MKFKRNKRPATRICFSSALLSVNVLLLPFVRGRFPITQIQIQKDRKGNNDPANGLGSNHALTLRTNNTYPINVGRSQRVGLFADGCRFALPVTQICMMLRCPKICAHVLALTVRVLVPASNLRSTRERGTRGCNLVEASPSVERG